MINSSTSGSQTFRIRDSHGLELEFEMSAAADAFIEERKEANVSNSPRINNTFELGIFERMADAYVRIRSSERPEAED